MKKRCLITVWLAVISTDKALIAQVPVSAYRANGTLVESYEDGTSSKYVFSVHVNDCKWLIRTIPEGQSPILYYEDSYDGTNVYTYRRLRNPSADIINKGTALVQANDIPNRNSPCAVGVWLGYASACYFSTVRDSEVKPFLLFGDALAKHESIKVELEQEKNYPFLPSRINYEPAKRTYRGIEFTNIHGVNIPKEFILEALSATLTATNTTRYRLYGKLTDFEVGTFVQDYHPELVGNTYTEDRRFGTKSVPDLKVIYNNTNADWVGKEDPQLNRRAKRLMAEAEAQGVKLENKNRKFLVTLLLVMPTIIIAFFLVKKARSK